MNICTLTMFLFKKITKRGKNAQQFKLSSIRLQILNGFFSKKIRLFHCFIAIQDKFIMTTNFFLSL